MIHGLGADLAEAMEMVLNSEAACLAKLHWRVETRPEGWDENDETSQAGGSVEDKEMEFRVLFHRVDHRMAGFQRHMEVSTGDVIIDYMADLALAGKEDPRIEVNGEFFVQKTAGAKLLEAWDAYMEHGGTMKTLLLTPAV